MVFRQAEKPVEDSQDRIEKENKRKIILFRRENFRQRRGEVKVGRKGKKWKVLSRKNFCATQRDVGHKLNIKVQ